MNCPSCNKEGQKVANETVKNIVQAESRGKIGEGDYYLCMSPDCDVAYYNSESIFEKSALNKPLWYKKNANPKYACYCREITQEEVSKTVMETRLTKADDIMLHLRGIVKSNCKINNPTGHCCHPAFNQMIKSALKNKASIDQRKSKE